jgi:hypothetical protein
MDLMAVFSGKKPPAVSGSEFNEDEQKIVDLGPSSGPVAIGAASAAHMSDSSEPYIEPTPPKKSAYTER